MRLHDLTEAPQRVAPTTFDLDNPGTNQQHAHRLMPKITEPIDETQDYTIFRTGDGHHGWVALYNKHTDRLDYTIQYQARNWNWLGQTVTQCILWRDPSSPYVRGLTIKMFFDYLLKRYPAIMSDRQQTTQGNDFWQARMTDAVMRHHRVGIADMNARRMNWYDPATDGDYQTWFRSQHTYDDPHRFQAIRYVIGQ